MKYLFLVISLFSYSLFLQSSEIFKTQLPFSALAPFYKAKVLQEDPSEIQIVHIPVDSRCYRDEYVSFWSQSQNLVMTHSAAKVSFARQFDFVERFEIPQVKIQRADGRSILASHLFLYRCMDAEFEHDQIAQLEIYNSGRVLSRKPLLRSVEEFKQFQFRSDGPKTLTVTKKGREILASLVMQYPEYPKLLQRFAENKKIDSDCLEKIQTQADVLSSQIETMKIDGRFR